MDGKMDNVFIERLWLSLKYECVYLKSLKDGRDARREIGDWIGHYNGDRPHSTFHGQTPNEVYNKGTSIKENEPLLKREKAA